jgi:hypothetical protein
VRAAALLLALTVAAPAAAAGLALSEAEVREAIRVGERSVTSEAFDAEWRVRNARGDLAVVMTPFHRLVVAARHAAFRSEPLKPGEPAKLLAEQKDRLVVWVHLTGEREDFARFYQPRLAVGEHEVKATFVQNERTAARQDDGTFLARCVYSFPTKELTGRSQVELVVTDVGGRQVTAFTIDLAAMR